MGGAAQDTGWAGRRAWRRRARPGFARLVLLVLLALVAGLASGVARAASGANKFNLLDAQLVRSLSRPVRANVKSMVRVGTSTGTGVLIDRAQGLVLTNAHVARANPGTVKFGNGQVRRIEEVLLSVPELDYAILRVSGAPAKAREARLRTGLVATGEHVYAVSAVPGLLDRKLIADGVHRSDPKAFVAAHAQTINPGPSRGRRLLGLAHEIARTGENVTFPTIQFGKEIGGGALTGVSFGNGPVWALKTTLPNAPGASGSPVFSADNHELVGLHFSGGNQLPWDSSEVSMKRIVEDLRVRANAPAVQPTTRARLASFLDRKVPAAAP